MPAYMVLAKFTEIGNRRMKTTVERVRATKEEIAAAGGKVIGVWWTMGHYDLVWVVEMPTDEIAMLTLLTNAMHQECLMDTLRAFSEDEMEHIVKRLPGIRRVHLP